MANVNKQKLYQEKDTKDSDDIISSLPDSILSHILSFLPTKDAVGTCILSTRWRNLWVGLPNIDLDDRLLYSRNVDSWYSYEYEDVPFMHFVEKVLIHHQVPNVTRFRLSCKVYFCPSRVRNWISSAIRLNVQELVLCLHLSTPFALPCCVFNCQSLRVLKIDMESPLILPQTVYLPNLKTLYLTLVELSDEESTHKLLSNCPALEELYLLDCDWGSLDCVTISIPTLRKLRIDDGLYWESSYETRNRTIEVQEANLVCFEYFGSLSTEILLFNQLSLLEAAFFVHNQPKRELYPASLALYLFKELQNVKFLRISSNTIKCLLLATRVFGELPVFEKLTHMELSIGIGDHFSEVLEFLGRLPYLEILTLPKGFDPHSHLNEEVRISMSSSKCDFSRLKILNLHFVNGSKEEMHVLKYLVENAPGLERISVTCSGNIVDSKNESRQLLQMLLEGSRHNFTILSS